MHLQSVLWFALVCFLQAEVETVVAERAVTLASYDTEANFRTKQDEVLAQISTERRRFWKLHFFKKLITIVGKGLKKFGKGLKNLGKRRKRVKHKRNKLTHTNYEYTKATRYAKAWNYSHTFRKMVPQCAKNCWWENSRYRNMQADRAEKRLKEKLDRCKYRIHRVFGYCYCYGEPECQ